MDTLPTPTPVPHHTPTPVPHHTPAPEPGHAPAPVPGQGVVPPRGAAPASRAAWIAVGGVLTVLAVGATALSAPSWFVYRSETRSMTYTPTADRVVVDVGVGDVTVRRAQGGSVAVTRRIRWSWSRPEVQQTWDGTTLDVDVRASFGAASRIHYVVRVPEGLGVEVRSSSGDVRVTELTADGRVSTGSGDVAVEQARAALWVRTSSGDVAVGSLAGEGNLATRSGDVAVEQARSSLTVGTSSGDVNAEGLASPRVESVTGSGDVRLRFTSAPDRVGVTAESGDVSVTVPEGSAYHVDTDTGSGDEDVDVQESSDAPRTVEVRTDSGDVQVREG